MSSGGTDWEPPDAARPAPSYPQYAYPPAANQPPQPAPPGYPAPYQHGPYPPYPPAAYPPGYPAAARGPGLPRPIAIEPVPGTPFGVAVVEVRPTTSGPATASLVVGIASILVAFVVGCFVQVGADPGWGPLVAGAFAVLASLAAVAAVWLCSIAMVRIRRSVGWGATRGRGMAIAGFVCAVVGLALTGAVMVVATLS